jgi:hypothetical protein
MENKLKITEDIRQQLTDKGIVICTYVLENDTEADCIDTIYQNDYPFLEVVTKKLINTTA